MNKMWIFFIKNWKSIIFALSLLIFVFLSRLLLKNEIEIFDNFVYKIISKLHCKPMTYFFKFISFLCSTWFLIFFSIVLMIIAKRRKNVFYIILNILLCFLLNQTAKYLFARTRPEDINLVIETGFSFPSGHSMVSLAFYGFFVYLLYHKKWSKKKRLMACIPLIILTLLVGISRIYLGVHYASDVLAGFALAMAYLIIFIKLFYKKMER